MPRRLLKVEDVFAITGRGTRGGPPSSARSGVARGGASGIASSGWNRRIHDRARPAGAPAPTSSRQERVRLDTLPGRAEVLRPAWNRGVDRLGTMKTRIMYIESKGAGLSGPARIGRVTFSKTGATLSSARPRRAPPPRSWRRRSCASPSSPRTRASPRRRPWPSPRSGRAA